VTNGPGELKKLAGLLLRKHSRHLEPHRLALRERSDAGMAQDEEPVFCAAIIFS
jgi:hypothetical protein